MENEYKVDVSRLDASKFIDIDFGSLEFRQGTRTGICASWAQSPPQYFMRYGIPNVIVGRYADVKSVYFDVKHFTPRPLDLPGYEPFNVFHENISVAQMDGDQHQRLRRLLNQSFTPKALAAIDESMKATVHQMVDEVEALGGPFDGWTDFVHNLFVRVIIGGLLGFTPKQQQALMRMYGIMLNEMNDLTPGEEFSEYYINAEKEATQALQDVVDLRRASPKENDLVSSLVTARYELDQLSDHELMSNLFGILAGGLGTTSTAAGAMLYNLCRYRDQYDQVVADRSLINQTVEESLRFQGAPIIAFPRFATDDIDLGGTLILKNMPVQVSMMAANLDPEQYPNPLKFDIHRRPVNIMTFGIGPHTCLGNRLARRLLAIVLGEVVARFPGLHLQDPNFVPQYPGGGGDLSPTSLPMHTGR